MQENEIYSKALSKWGLTSQIIKTLEELGELSVVLSKSLNYPLTPIEDIVDEIVDVEIMLKQLKIVFNKSYIDIKIKKLERLKKMLVN